MRILLCVVLFSGTLGLAAAQAIPEPKVFPVSSAKELGIPFFPSFGFPQSDRDGDLFFHVGAGVYSDATLLKLSHSSWDPTLFKLPAELARDYNFYDYSVSPAGDVWMLANSEEPGFLAVEFDKSGQVKEQTHLDIAIDEIDIGEFAALDNSVLLMSGVYGAKAAPGLRGHSLLALFDGSSGKKLRDVQDPFRPADPAEKPAAMHEGAMVAAPDSNIYLLHQSQILVVNAGGEVTRRISFKKPKPGLLAANLSVSTGRAAVWLSEVDKTNHVVLSFLVLDLATGKPLGWYSAPDSGNALSIGFSDTNSLAFLGRKEGKLVLIEAAVQ